MPTSRLESGGCEERAVWEQLAQESQAERNDIAARLANLQATAEQAPKTEAFEYLQAGVDAAARWKLRAV